MRDPIESHRRAVLPRVSVLLVDDRTENLLALEAVLEPLGQRLVRATSGEEALAAVLEEDFAVILMDIRMPGLDGFETMKLLKEREHTRRVPIIFISGYPAEHHGFASYAVGAVDYILKPIDPEALRSKVSVFVNLRQHELALQIARSDLEKRVAERTAELEAANRQLAREIAERKQAERHLYEQAFHDPLTGLANRSLLTIHLDRAIARYRRQSQPGFAVALLDIDRFKVVNDSLGHLAGDDLLVGIARRLVSALRDVDTVARLGGDEFALLLDGVSDVKDATRLLERIEGALAAPFDVNGHEVFASASMGITMMVPRYQTAEDLIRDADAAMYRAKAAGRARYQVFDVGMHEAVMAQLELEGELRRAIERDELCLHYQPIVSLEEDHVTGVEALVRWQHPTRGLLMPDRFIPLAEEVGLIRRLGQWVLERACQDLAAWQAEGVDDLVMSVNFSASQLMSPTLPSEIARAARRARIELCQLNLEITETTMMAHRGVVERNLREIWRQGTTVSLDDFGTGHSCLGHLHELPVSTLKIDRSFLKHLGDPEDRAEIVQTIIALAHNLKMDVVAEGVERPDQLERLRRMGCERGQGFLFSEPLPSSEARRFCAERRRSSQAS